MQCKELKSYVHALRQKLPDEKQYTDIIRQEAENLGQVLNENPAWR